MSSYQYRKSHCGDKTVVRSSYLHNGISYTDEAMEPTPALGGPDDLVDGPHSSPLDIPNGGRAPGNWRARNGSNASLSSRVSESGRCTPITLYIERPVLTQMEFDRVCEPIARKSNGPSDWAKQFRNYCACNAQCLQNVILRRLPFINIMRNYNVKQDLLSDIISGLTVGVMHIPQGMAYGMLASVAPIYGLYTSFFPVILYFFVGTSRHISLGTFAVISLMVGSVVDQAYCPGSEDDLVLTPRFMHNDTSTMAMTTDETSTSILSASSLSVTFSEEDVCRISVAAAVTLLAGIMQLIMGVCNLGFVAIYLSEPLTRGFTTGAACHVFTSQIKHLLGLEIERFSGPLTLVYTYIALGQQIMETNVAAVIISVVCIVMLIVVKELINPRIKEKIRMPVPMELIVVILGTVASHYGHFGSRYDVPVMGEIPTGFPAPKFPPTNNMFEYLGPAFSIAIVAFAISISMSKLFAKKHGYEIDSNQELIAYGITNGICANFHCFMTSASLSRSLVQEDVGGKTQVAGLVSCLLLVIVLVAIGPLFENLPTACLAAIILVALKGMFKQLGDLKRLWKVDKYDFLIWLVAFLATVFLEVDMGLVVGLTFSLLTVVFRTQRPYTCLLGQVPDTDIYKDIDAYDVVDEVPHVKIFRFESSLYYANQEHFVQKLFSKTGLDPRSVATDYKPTKNDIHQQLRKRSRQNGDCREPSGHSAVESGSDVEPEVELSMPGIRPPHTIILDCSTMGYIDSAAANTIKQLIDDFRCIGVNLYFAGCKLGVRNSLISAGVDIRENLYLTIHDAVIFATDAGQDSENTELEGRKFSLDRITKGKGI